MKPKHLALILLIDLIWAFNIVAVKLAIDDAGPLTAVMLRYGIVALACLTRRNSKGDGVVLRISRNAAVVSTTKVDAPVSRIAVPVTLRAGETVSFAISPGQSGLGDQYLYRYRMLRPDSALPAC